MYSLLLITSNMKQKSNKCKVVPVLN